MGNTTTLTIIDNSLAKAIDNTNMHPLRKSLYKKIILLDRCKQLLGKEAEGK